MLFWSNESNLSSEWNSVLSTEKTVCHVVATAAPFWRNPRHHNSETQNENEGSLLSTSCPGYIMDDDATLEKKAWEAEQGQWFENTVTIHKKGDRNYESTWHNYWTMALCITVHTISRFVGSLISESFHFGSNLQKKVSKHDHEHLFFMWIVLRVIIGYLLLKIWAKVKNFLRLTEPILGIRLKPPYIHEIFTKMQYGEKNWRVPN